MNVIECSPFVWKSQDRHTVNLASMCSKSQIIFLGEIIITPNMQAYESSMRY